jgi:LysR family glycine cleavage system transcriptional activator
MIDPALRMTQKPWAISFREELHAVDAVAAGQGIAICSDVIVSGELQSGVLVKAHSLSLPGYGFYLLSLTQHVRRSDIEAFATWVSASTNTSRSSANSRRRH